MASKVKEINNVSDFLGEVREFVKRHNDEIVVFRGEDKIFDKPCIPSIFRDSGLSESRFYEKNLLDSMRQNKLSFGDSYLDNAIDAQHGEFPSRLLDVTYNCLIALYFAVTPYYHKDVEENDNEMGCVYMFHFNNVSSPSAKETKQCYEDIINKKNKILSDNLLFGKNHIFIDNCKNNNRIIAQQGAFILFQGDDPEPLPSYILKGIIIPAKRKSAIREELDQLFGINTGSVYPEIFNLVKGLTRKSKKIKNVDYTIKGILKEIEQQFELELEFYIDERINEDDPLDRVNILIELERTLYSYQVGIISLLNYIDKIDNEDTKEKIKENIINFINGYNNYLTELKNVIPKQEIANIDSFKISVNGEKNG